ncbi:MAG: hypothetical protein A2289_24730 [Deltaproteobacteria bacterium RIFOXYA12_FULL_58_15]|nr:MAG: hypothetical protein A2289_24730 [Deltaproteobacteria bacterium RIFOXYA12_FULL_58_15]OGR12686.1 MAG: hypothetical protein A2341_07685 [Deltaproteobacteria bacterium RIFOXYB12_FULL_58_9]
MFVVDTNVLVYAADERAPEHTRCRALLLGWRAEILPWHLTWSIVYEFVRVVTHPRVFVRPWSAPQAWTFIDALLAASSLKVLVATEGHAEVARTVMNEVPDLRGNLLHDAHIAILMKEHGIHRIYTRDTDFHRFPFVEPVDPLAV